MKGPLGVSALSLALAALLTWPLSREARAQSDPRRAVDPYEPSDHGSEWFASDSLDLRGHGRPSLGYVVALAHRSYVVESTDGSGERAPVKDLAILHVGGSLVLFERLRVAFDMPFQLLAGGQSAIVDGASIPAPPKEGGFGDLRLGGDVRVFGDHRRGVTGAVGLQLWLPTGQKSQWMSDGTLRAQPRAMVAGTHGPFVWAAQLGVLAREGSELTASAAAGVRITKAFVIGPELFASSMVDDPFAKKTTPVELLFGFHWLIDGTARAGIAVGHGFTDGIGAPASRALFAIEWAPEIPAVRRPRVLGKSDPGYKPPSDEDHDGIPDSEDACPLVVGIATSDPKTNGCPPDADGDGIDDLADACPTVPGIATQDPATNGCPVRDRDKDGVLDEVDACPDDAGPRDPEPRRNGCPKAFVHAARIELLDPIEFKPGGAELTATRENEAILTAVLGVMLRVPETSKLRVEGHTDDRGDAANSRKLGAARATAVAKWLVDHGIDASRITSEGIGPDRPLTTNETEVGRAENRRIELHLVP